MSRSNPNDNGTPNPSVRWFEWNGENGTVRYYDKEAKRNVEVGSKFRFMLLDQLASVRGWHDASDSGIYSNEVKDTAKQPLVVKSFKGGTLVEGVYKQIKDRVNALGGQFVTNCYIAFKHDGDTLAIGSLRFKGAALNAWIEFCKANRPALYSKAIEIDGYTEGKKGRIVFRVPVLKIVEVSAESNNQAVGLDAELQGFLKDYFKRTTRDQAERTPEHEPMEEDNTPEYDNEGYNPSALTDDDIPF